MLKNKTVRRIIGWAMFLLFCTATLLLAIKISLPAAAQYGNDYADIDYTDFGKDITTLVASAEETPVLENDYLRLSVGEGGIISLLNKSTGTTYYSSMPSDKQSYFDEDSNDLQSVVSCEYLTDSVNTAVMYSYDESVKRQQYRIALSEDESTLQVEYILGEKAEDSGIPEAIRREFFEKELLKKLDDEDAEYLRRRYTLYSFDELTVYDDPEALLKEYPGLENGDFYIVTDMKNDRVRKKTVELLNKAGYTEKDMQADNEASGVNYNVEIPIFHIVIRYFLDGESLVVEVPKEEIQYTAAYPLLRLTVHKFFLSSAQCNGTVLIPAGSGALMCFDEQSSKTAWEAPFYGGDATTVAVEMQEEMLNDTSMTLPVYSLQSLNGGVLAIIEQGAASSALCVKRDGQSVFAHTKFTVLQSDNVYYKNTKNSVAVANDDANCDLVMRYSFFDTDNPNDYSSVSSLYRSYLISNGLINEKTDEQNPAIVLELIGSAALNFEKYNLYSKKENAVLTDFDSMAKITADFSPVSSNLNIKISGYSDEGLYSQTPGTIKPNSDLGGKKGFEKLIKTVEQNGAKAYLEIANMYYYDYKATNSLGQKSVSLYADNSKAYLKQYDAVNGFYLKGSLKTAIISPKLYCDFAEKYSTYEYSGFSLGRFCSDINSDYNGESFYDRSRTQTEIEKSLEAYKENKKSLTAKNANLYAIKYLDLIESQPLDAGGNVVFDKEIPFKQLVLHGSISYTTEPLNLKSDFKAEVLKCIETGSGLQFVFADKMYDEIFGSDYSYLYMTEYSRNAKEALEASVSVSNALKGLNGIAITNHEINGNITKTTYQNGAVIYVNHGDTEEAFDGVSVPAESYIRK